MQIYLYSFFPYSNYEAFVNVHQQRQQKVALSISQKNLVNPIYISRGNKKILFVPSGNGLKELIFQSLPAVSESTVLLGL